MLSEIRIVSTFGILFCFFGVSTASNQTPEKVNECHMQLLKPDIELTSFASFASYKKHIDKKYCKTPPQPPGNNIDILIKNKKDGISNICIYNVAKMDDDLFVKVILEHANEQNIRNWRSCLENYVKEKPSVIILKQDKINPDGYTLTAYWVNKKIRKKPDLVGFGSINIKCTPKFIDRIPIPENNENKQQFNCKWSSRDMEKGLVTLRISYRKPIPLFGYFFSFLSLPEKASIPLPLIRTTKVPESTRVDKVTNELVVYQLKQEEVVNKQKSIVSHCTKRIPPGKLQAYQCANEYCICGNKQSCYTDMVSIKDPMNREKNVIWRIADPLVLKRCDNRGKCIPVSLVNSTSRLKNIVKSPKIASATIVADNNLSSYKVCAKAEFVTKFPWYERLKLYQIRTGRRTIISLPKGANGRLRGNINGKIFEIKPGESFKHFIYLGKKKDKHAENTINYTYLLEQQ